MATLNSCTTARVWRDEKTEDIAYGHLRSSNNVHNFRTISHSGKNDWRSSFPDELAYLTSRAGCAFFAELFHTAQAKVKACLIIPTYCCKGSSYVGRGSSWLR